MLLAILGFCGDMPCRGVSATDFTNKAGDLLTASRPFVHMV